MPILSLQELMLVVPVIVLIIIYHLYLNRKVQKYPLTAAVGVTHHALRYEIVGGTYSLQNF